jgi:hypothetical protein
MRRNWQQWGQWATLLSLFDFGKALRAMVDFKDREHTFEEIFEF